jgi:hypothetical protein
MESSVLKPASLLLMEGEAPLEVMMGLGIRRGSCSGDARNRCTDRRKARVDFMATASESLLSDGRRWLTRGRVTRGRLEMWLESLWTEDVVEVSESHLESTLGRLIAKL